MISISPKMEFPAILPAGLHKFTLESLRETCVKAFPNSKTRDRLMQGIEEIVHCLLDVKVEGEIWVDGSFLTYKMNPYDADMVLHLPIEAYENGTSEQKTTIEWIRSNQKETLGCDSYLRYIFPEGDYRSSQNDFFYRYWLQQFGYSRRRNSKGIAVIRIGGDGL